MKLLLLTAKSNAGDYVSYILTGLIVAAIIYMYTQMKASKQSLNDYVTNNPDTIFKSLSIISTIGECASLAIIAMNNGWDTFSSLFRYGMIGTMEIYASYFFISSFVYNMNKSTKDGYITFKELLGIFFKSSLFFIFAFGITGAIHFFYIESLNIVYGVQYDAKLFYPWVYIDFEINTLLEAPADATYSLDPKDPDSWSGGVVPGKISIAIIFLIYSSTLFNIFLVITSFFNYEGKIRFRREEAIEAEEVDENGIPIPNVTPPPSSSKTNKYFKNIKSSEDVALFNFTPFITSMFGIDESEFKKFIYEKIGLDLDTKLAINTAKTIPGVDPIAKTEKITNELINSSPWGLQKFYDHSWKVAEEMEILEKSMNKINELRNIISSTSTTPALKASSQSDLNTEKQRYTSFVAKQKGFYQMFIAGKREIISLLKTNKCPYINEVLNVFETDFNTYERFVP